eukprot:CAMPEP_0170586538 /NCGR_PEP_ID=MMETSP0224-20130122/9799_1 /TAXON_ID=285029 /ORGANISM="Togula jolla, Strain CCCM 725" /LENGTH=613 /DNA_ID=CAMNT_0010910093 /DNA_START=132 /DNA_END=1973 /DNA_ORIENTATION=+
MPKALLFAFPCACFALILKVLVKEGYLPWLLYEGEEEMNIFSNNAAYTGFNLAMSFLFVFRTSQAYSRFWEGFSVGHRMYAEWFDFASCVVAFSRYSKKGAEATRDYQHRLVRLLSLLHAAAVASLRGMDGSSFDLIDLPGLDDDAIDHALSCEHPVPLIFQWLMELVVEGEHEGILAAPPPIISRAFQELANGLVAYHDASKIQNTQFPLPYLQMQSILLFAHWILTPFVMCQWVKWVSWVFFLTLIQALVFWSLYFTALEIEFPFKQGDRLQNYAAKEMHVEFNHQLLVLIDPVTRLLPKLHANAIISVTELRQDKCEHDLEYNAMTKVSPQRRSVAPLNKARQMIRWNERRQFASELEAEQRTSVFMSQARADDYSRSESQADVSPAAGIFSGCSSPRWEGVPDAVFQATPTMRQGQDEAIDGTILPKAAVTRTLERPERPVRGQRLRMKDSVTFSEEVRIEGFGPSQASVSRLHIDEHRPRDVVPVQGENEENESCDPWSPRLKGAGALDKTLNPLERVTPAGGDQEAIEAQDVFNESRERENEYGDADAGAVSFELVDPFGKESEATSPRSIRDARQAARRYKSMRPGWFGQQHAGTVIAQRSMKPRR